MKKLCGFIILAQIKAGVFDEFQAYFFSICPLTTSLSSQSQLQEQARVQDIIRGPVCNKKRNKMRQCRGEPVYDPAWQWWEDFIELG